MYTHGTDPVGNPPTADKTMVSAWVGMPARNRQNRQKIDLVSLKILCGFEGG